MSCSEGGALPPFPREIAKMSLDNGKLDDYRIVGITYAWRANTGENRASNSGSGKTPDDG